MLLTKTTMKKHGCFNNFMSNLSIFAWYLRTPWWWPEIAEICWSKNKSAVQYNHLTVLDCDWTVVYVCTWRMMQQFKSVMSCTFPNLCCYIYQQWFSEHLQNFIKLIIKNWAPSHLNLWVHIWVCIHIYLMGI